MKTLRHPNIIKLIEVLETEQHICLVLEYCPAGEFFDLISKNGRVCINSFLISYFRLKKKKQKVTLDN